MFVQVTAFLAWIICMFGVSFLLMVIPAFLSPMSFDIVPLSFVLRDSAFFAGAFTAAGVCGGGVPYICLALYHSQHHCSAWRTICVAAILGSCCALGASMLIGPVVAGLLIQFFGSAWNPAHGNSFGFVIGAFVAAVIVSVLVLVLEYWLGHRRKLREAG